LDRLAVLAGRSWHTEDLPGGLTNRNLHVVTDDRGEVVDVVVRCNQSDEALLDIDRAAEHANTRAAAEAGVGAPVLEYRPELGMLVIGFLPGRTLADEDFADPVVLRCAAEACRRLHHGPRFVNEFDMFARQARYRATVRERGFPLPATYDEHADAWDAVRRALAASPRPSVPCNNDLLAANFLDQGGRVRLIDYEYSGNNEAAFELGNTATECGFSDEQVAAYVEAYYDAPTRADLARVRLQMMVSAYGWALWGCIQAATSPLDFDFWGWGSERFEKAAAGFRDPTFRHLLEDVVDG
jgi:thiamine kinase-like enzyme